MLEELLLGSYLDELERTIARVTLLAEVKRGNQVTEKTGTASGLLPRTAVPPQPAACGFGASLQPTIE